ncbi:MAG: transcription antitermination factor NusB [Nitriliruptorales bacterium]|nr:transcription antitermination factor NusB [Nitriliruptorales bacterium]
MHTQPSRSRRAGRKRALEILYEADLKGRPLPAVLAEHLSGEGPDALSDFSVAIVRGVYRHRDELDALIQANARDWKLSRMPIVDRNLLRMGLYEILHDPEVPNPVAINEAVDLAKELSTDDSGRFVNGLLARVAERNAPAGA